MQMIECEEWGAVDTEEAGIGCVKGEFVCTEGILLEQNLVGLVLEIGGSTVIKLLAILTKAENLDGLFLYTWTSHGVVEGLVGSKAAGKRAWVFAVREQE